MRKKNVLFFFAKWKLYNHQKNKAMGTSRETLRVNIIVSIHTLAGLSSFDASSFGESFGLTNESKTSIYI